MASDASGGEIFVPSTSALGPPSPLYIWYRVSFTGLKRPGRGASWGDIDIYVCIKLFLYAVSFFKLAN
jgi:hypothetical protein